MSSTTLQLKKQPGSYLATSMLVTSESRCLILLQVGTVAWVGVMCVLHLRIGAYRYVCYTNDRVAEAARKLQK
jgi:hypothetical protein